MIDARQLRELVVRPALEAIDLWSPAAEALVVGTAAAESRLMYLAQLGGPALGLFQCEPGSHSDIWRNYLDFRKPLARLVLDAGGIGGPAVMPSHDALIFNLRYAAAICRIHYRRAPEPLPEADDVRGLGEYWKAHFNTSLGAGTVEHFIEAYEVVA